MADNLSKYFHIWWLLTSNATQIAFSSKFGAVIFMLGKVFRFGFFLFFLLLVLSRTDIVAGYTMWQMIFFFATFNLVDMLSQFFLREVYRFRSYVVSGNFDYMLTKPLSPLLRSLFGGSDILDLGTLVALFLFVLYVTTKLDGVTVVSVILYVLLIINAFFIAIAFHIFVLALGVLTTEVDNAIWVFREMTQLGRIPVDMYREPVSWILTFIVPVAVMISFPARAIMGLLSYQTVLLAFGICIALLYMSVRFWHYALKQYASASS